MRGEKTAEGGPCSHRLPDVSVTLKLRRERVQSCYVWKGSLQAEAGGCGVFKGLPVCLRAVGCAKVVAGGKLGGVCKNQTTSSLLGHVRTLDFIVSAQGNHGKDLCGEEA